MRDMALIAAGSLGILAALIHGWLGESKVIGPAKFPNRLARDLTRVIWQLSTLVWIAGSVTLILMAATDYIPVQARTVVAAVSAAPMLVSALGNMWVSRGRHFGWMVLAVVVALAAYGASPP